ncbi:MAG: hypothetical protein HC772_20730, partial [Leptolyngbyaceae cyanobacterium CRU_2_3]|nr:hypothetical protein [Leptolyngbyaceae cyanobacterium CRU_2_3]
AAADLKQAEQLFTQQKDTVNRQRVLQALKELEFALAEARKPEPTSKQTSGPFNLPHPTPHSLSLSPNPVDLTHPASHLLTD